MAYFRTRSGGIATPPCAFVREWPRLQDWHHRHLSYAGQWFLLAGVTVCAYLALWRSRRLPSA
jgi:cytochrome oxidase assembly protein ShyY1